MSEGRVFAFVLAVTEIGKEHQVAQKVLEASKEVGVEARTFIVYGEYDLVIELSSKSLKDIDRAVTMIRSLPGVLRTVTLISAE
ncbi:MAG: Lrp/AsnC ligand binding domain-containing protein [Thermoproteota archaeon]|jgi:DNA-binding Lrp family transcriptional regulator